jgi:Ca2+-binding RTX toxin-like protein
VATVFGNDSDNLIIANGLANKIQGEGGDDTLIGGAGNDSLNGGFDNDSIDGGTGADTMNGDLGDDIYRVDNAGDKIIEFDLGGNDTILASIAINLANYAHVENVTLSGAAALSAIGDGDANHLIGNSGGNLLDGGGGADTMEGGAGNDTYVVDNPGDVIIEVAGGGVDTVKSSISYELTDLNLENLTLTGTDDIDGTGNVLANTITGNSGDNILDGGVGADKLVGGLGNDTYIVDDAKDVVTEAANGGSDTVKTSLASYTLATNVEDLVLLAGAGKGAGNTLDNHILGNGGANTLDGGAGNDTVTGNGGDDVITVSNGNDVVRYTDKLDGHDIINGFDGNATGGQDTLDLDMLFDGLSVATASRAALVTLAPAVGHVDVNVDVSLAHDGSNIITVATLNTTDTITVGQAGADVILGTG